MDARNATENCYEPHNIGTGKVLTGCLDWCNEEVACQELCNSVLHSDLACERLLKESDKVVPQWRRHEEAIEGHFERFGVDVESSKYFR